MDGKFALKVIRETSEAPIIVISARHQESEKIAALDDGADDYVDKPFEIGVLLARMRSALRRQRPATKDKTVFVGGPLRVDFAKREVFLFGEPVHLSPKEYMLLHTLARSAGQIVTQRRLLAAGWGSETTDHQYLRVYIGLLRQKIEADPGAPEILITEQGLGYRLKL
jgi:two-component system KDP operon response regulator KdpE